MLNDIKTPPLYYGSPDPDTSAVPITARLVVGAGPLASRDASRAHRAGVHPTPHREVLEGHPTLPRRDPTTARTPDVLKREEAREIGHAVATHPHVTPDIARAARHSDVPDGSVYEYPSRGSTVSMTLSIVVVIGVVLFIGLLKLQLVM